jgi:hypothetical protein
MKAMNSLFVLTAAALMSAAPAIAQQDGNGKGPSTDSSGSAPAAPATSSKGTEGSATISSMPAIEIQYFRPQDQRGLNLFEPPKHAGVAYEGFKLNLGAAFTQQFQALKHSNTADPKLVNGTDANQLIKIGNGFNNAVANLYVNAQLARGIRVALTSYLSSRHHNETWVKDGYLLVDDSPIKSEALENLMKYVTLRLGHFEVNYGDAHFRRSDNGNAMYNPFVGNLIMDAFTTEIGGEVYVRANGMLAMAGMTAGESRGNVLQPENRSPAFLGKLGFDKQLNSDLRVRLTGSAFSQQKSINNTLYAGDRAGSRYYYVMENSQATESAQFTSGLVNPGFRSKVNAFMVNPFVKYQGLELFGVAEHAKGRAANETTERSWNQYAGDVVYRFLPGEKMYVGGRYNVAEGELTGMPSKVKVDRMQLGAGWFITGNILMKGEYVNQKYHNFPTTDIRSGGKFNGFIMEGVVAF